MRSRPSRRHGALRLPNACVGFTPASVPRLGGLRLDREQRLDGGALEFYLDSKHLAGRPGARPSRGMRWTGA